MTEQQLLEQAEQFIKDNERAIVADIAEVVAVRSVEEAPAPGAPFGPGPRKALDATLAIARRMGLATNDGEGYVGWAELPGTGEGHIATITHVDIVPEGEGWDGDPLILREQDGWLIGRGVSDDKGPGILCLYLAKFFKQLDIPLRYGLRVLVGTNEESGMEDVEYYLKHNPEPLFCFSPDAEFPLANGEKGVFEGELISPPLAGNIIEFSGGLASNVVTERAYCVVRADVAALPSAARITPSEAGNGLVRLDARGTGGHAAHPQGTVNAIALLVNYLLDNKLCAAGPEHDFITLLGRLHGATDGSGVGVDCQDGLFDPLTCIGGMISMENGILKQDINIRYPTCTTGEALTETLSAVAAQCGGSFTAYRNAKPFYISPDSAPINALMAAYKDITGSGTQPFTMGGGTYARHFKHAVSYGPQEKGLQRPPFTGPEHSPNEGAELAALLRALKVYILAVWKLQQLEL